MPSERGFTLLEVMTVLAVVVFVLGIVLSAAVASKEARQRAATVSLLSTARSLIQTSYAADEAAATARYAIGLGITWLVDLLPEEYRLSSTAVRTPWPGGGLAVGPASASGIAGMTAESFYLTAQGVPFRDCEVVVRRVADEGDARAVLINGGVMRNRDAGVVATDADIAALCAPATSTLLFVFD
jgi:prepilin-type N-terminal cleavage/methylation domain-containing protein